mmetsp:Transcript_63009/g.149276  ORF Transcript_63009/g.149276 Transcript_63009/m.149276 type:complete len:299 (-) Transcript_63009:353-1249(-)
MLQGAMLLEFRPPSAGSSLAAPRAVRALDPRDSRLRCSGSPPSAATRPTPVTRLPLSWTRTVSRHEGYGCYANDVRVHVAARAPLAQTGSVRPSTTGPALSHEQGLRACVEGSGTGCDEDCAFSASDLRIASITIISSMSNSGPSSQPSKFTPCLRRCSCCVVARCRSCPPSVVVVCRRDRSRREEPSRWCPRWPSGRGAAGWESLAAKGPRDPAGAEESCDGGGAGSTGVPTSPSWDVGAEGSDMRRALSIARSFSRSSSRSFSSCRMRIWYSTTFCSSSSALARSSAVIWPYQRTE